MSTIKAHRSDLLVDITSSAPVFSEDPPQEIQDKWNYGITLNKYILLLLLLVFIFSN